MKKWFKILAGLAMIGITYLALSAIFLPQPSSRHPDFYVSRAVIAPFPATLHHVRTLSLFEPSLGDGLCVAAYSIAPGDFERLLQAHTWTEGFITGNFDAEKNFRTAWPTAAPEFEAYHFTIDNRSYVDMAVSRDHTRIIFYMPI